MYNSKHKASEIEEYLDYVKGLDGFDPEDKANKIMVQNATLYVENWMDDTDGSGFYVHLIDNLFIATKTVVIEMDGATDEDFNMMQEFEFSPRLIVNDSTILVRAKKQPDKEINVTYHIIF